MYLMRKKGLKQAAHLWDGKDTFCRMYSTGGLVKSNYTVIDNAQGRKVCTMCEAVKQRNQHL